MAPAKKGSSPQRRPVVPPALAKTVGWLVGPGRTMSLLALVLVALGGGWYLIWRAVGPGVLSSEDYRLTADGVEITPVPEWIHKQDRDICREVFRDASLDGGRLSIHDRGLAEKIRSAFALNPWVAKVNGVRTYYPARVKVDLVYRRPVCVVEVGSERLPVDRDGVLLPREDLSTTEAARFPRLVRIDGLTSTLVGQRWNDPRVAGAAEIADAFGPAWEKLGLEVIVPLYAAGTDRVQDCSYELATRGGTRILWGRAPSSAFPGESSPAEKVGRLQEYQKEHGTLEGMSGAQQLDLTRAGSIERR